MVVAITGASGFIGRHLVAHLTGRGVAVRAIVRPRRQPVPLVEGAHVVVSPLERQQLARAFAGVDAVVHSAGVVKSVHRREYFDVNVTATRAVSEAARDAGARLVHISSLAAAGPAPSSRPKREDDPPAPITEYGRTKLEGERIVQSIPGLPFTIVRPGLVYGPADRALLPLFRLVRYGFVPLVARHDAAYTFVHVKDAAASIEAAIRAKPTGATIFVGYRQPTTARQLAEGIQQAMGREAVVVTLPRGIVRVASVIGDLIERVARQPVVLNTDRFAELSAEGFVCSVDRLREELGVVAAVDLKQGLADAAAWYREHRWL